MAEIKTKPTAVTPDAFIAAIDNPVRRADAEAVRTMMARLGKHRTGKSCLYIRKLADVDMGVLEEITRGALAHMDARYPRA